MSERVGLDLAPRRCQRYLTMFIYSQYATDWCHVGVDKGLNIN